MSKLYLSLCFSILLYSAVLAQSPMINGDSLLRQGLLMTRYDKDTSADAIILSDVGKISIEIDPNVHTFRKNYTRSVTYKIFTEAGFSNGTWAIPLIGKGDFADEIIHLHAATYNMENGKIVGTALNENDIHEEKDSKYLTIKKFALPDIKVGSVITVSYTLRTNNTTNFEWVFQHNIPVMYSEFSFKIPSLLGYMSLKQNIDTSKLSFSEEREDGIFYYWSTPFYFADFKYVYRNIPAFKEEAFTTNPQDYMAKVLYQYFTFTTSQYGHTHTHNVLNTWKQFSNTLLDNEYFGGYMQSKPDYIEKVIEQLNLGNKLQIEKIKVIVNYVKSNYKWNNIFSYFPGEDMKDFIKNQTGNSANINLLLIALLNAANINATPLILSIRSHGEIKTDYPFYNFYNDVICYVKTDSSTVLLDATEPLLPYYALPAECINDRGLIVQRNDSQWVSLKPHIASMEIKKMMVKFSPGLDSVNSDFTIKANGYLGYEYRKEWNEGYDKFSKMLTEGKELEITDSIKTFSVKNPEEAMAVVYSASYPLNRQKIDSSDKYRIVLSPFLNEPIRENPLKMPNREYPVDMNYQREFKYQSMVVIPDGYRIVETPSEIDNSILNGKAVFSYKVKQISNNVIQFSSDLSFNEAIFYPDEYQDLKKFYDVVIKKYKAPIILEKN